MDKQWPAVGTRVEIVDGSEAHGDQGAVWCVVKDVCLIELDEGCVWPITELREIRVIEGKNE